MPTRIPAMLIIVKYAKFSIIGIFKFNLPIIGNSISDSEKEYNAIKKIKALMNAKYRISKLSGCILVT